MKRKHLYQALLISGLIVAGIILLSFNRQPLNKEAEKSTNSYTGKGKKLSFQVIILNTKVLKELLSEGVDTIVFQQANREDDATGLIFKKRNRYELTAYVRYKDGILKKSKDIFYTYNNPSVRITKGFKTVVNDNHKGIDANFGNLPLNLNEPKLKLNQINPDSDENYRFLVLHPRAGTNKGNVDFTNYVVYDLYYASGKKDIDPDDSPEGKIDYQALFTLNPSPPA
jgi:hypothetical protein